MKERVSLQPATAFINNHRKVPDIMQGAFSGTLNVLYNTGTRGYTESSDYVIDKPQRFLLQKSRKSYQVLS